LQSDSAGVSVDDLDADTPGNLRPAGHRFQGVDDRGKDNVLVVDADTRPARADLHGHARAGVVDGRTRSVKMGRDDNGLRGGVRAIEPHMSFGPVPAIAVLICAAVDPDGTAITRAYVALSAPWMANAVRKRDTIARQGYRIAVPMSA
jgi:hypothetical protein